jgi:hypothetical protein
MSRETSVVRVTSIDEEDRLIGRCPCGGAWALAFNEVMLRREAWVDHLRMRCPACAARQTFEFDVSSFFLPRPRVWARAPIGRRLDVVARYPIPPIDIHIRAAA